MMKLILILLGAVMLAGRGEAVNLVEKASQLGLTALVSALESAGLSDTIANGGNFTIFAPTNAAFDAAGDVGDQLSAILQYHVISGWVMSGDLSNELLAASLQGQEIRINIYNLESSTAITASGRQVTNPDQTADNGVIHIVDGVLLPPTGTVTDYVAGNADFSTLLAAVQAANLGDTLAGAGPFTVFAPNNAAFNEIPSADLDALLADVDRLTAVLMMHVVPATVYSKGLQSTQVVASLNEDEQLTITSNSNGVTINGVASVVTADITVTNGAIHAIDKVLMPETSGATTRSLAASLFALVFMVIFL